MEEQKYYKRVENKVTTQVWSCMDTIVDPETLISASCEVVVLVPKERWEDELMCVPFDQIASIGRDEFCELLRTSKRLIKKEEGPAPATHRA